MSTSSAQSSEPTFGSHVQQQIDMPYRMICALAEDFTEEEAHRSVDGSKPLVWYLAHVAITKNYLLTIFADSASQLPKEYVERFGRGSDGSADFSDAPSKADLLECLAKIHENAMKFVGALEPADMGRSLEGDAIHPRFRQLGSAITLVASHDGYHAGQIGVLRSSMGKDPLFG